MKDFIVITEIYYKTIQISKTRRAKEKLSKQERDYLIQSMYSNLFGKMGLVEIYTEISVKIKEIYNIKVSERTIQRSLKT